MELTIKIHCGDHHHMSQGKAFFQVTVNPVATQIVLTPGGTQDAPALLPDENVGEAIAEFDIVASGGVGPYTFALEGTLPPGVSLLSNDVDTARITGTPTAAGTFNFDVVATDSQGAPAQASFRKVVR